MAVHGIASCRRPPVPGGAGRGDEVRIFMYLDLDEADAEHVNPAAASATWCISQHG